MSKLAVIFPGQGVQYVGMGESFYEKYPLVKKIYQQANDVLGYDLADVCFHGNVLKLNKNEILFPAILTTCVAIFRQFQAQYGIWPDYFLGHSLGEYSALTASGVIEFEDTLKIVQMRGKLSTASNKLGSMTIVENILPDVLEDVCMKLREKEEQVYISCYNTKSQMAVSGKTDSVMAVEEEVNRLGGKVTPLISSGPLHSVCMQEYTEQLKEIIDNCKINAGEYNVVFNVTGKKENYMTKESMKKMMLEHMVHPVLWERAVKEISRYEKPIFIEMGPKAYLKSLIKQIEPEAQGYCFGVKQDQEEIVRNKEFLELKKYSNNIFEQAIWIALTVLPNKNPQYQVEKVSGWVDDIEKLHENCQINVGVSLEIKEQVILLLRNIMEEKKVSEEEKIYWMNMIKKMYLSI
ncbi:ACP S-malonyltransferase [Clostridium felsineum]|uniref:ACP S-malonyltransferase n=1 Tax=Clostridium felsineum TaxID=36839 RepID=UPI00098C8166|nr:ACP S-malonyltransferase [Clostridium felsineum]URZ01274.1 hypothetical protein CLAUR_012630 [Clostridium felsineum]